MGDYVGRFVVAVATPIIAGLSASFAIWAADNLPGAPQIDGEGLAAVGSAAALAVGAAAYKWIENRGKFERGES